MVSEAAVIWFELFEASSVADVGIAVPFTLSTVIDGHVPVMSPEGEAAAVSCPELFVETKGARSAQPLN